MTPKTNKTYLHTAPTTTVDIEVQKRHCDNRNNMSHQHGHPHQKFLNELMREYDPNDPANKNRTFDKMVAAANKKHLNPGEQSFHYYVDEDNQVHGFIAVGNINDKLPHIIISDTGDDASYTEVMSKLQDFMELTDIDAIRDELVSFKYIVSQTKQVFTWVSMEEADEPEVPDVPEVPGD